MQRLRVDWLAFSGTVCYACTSLYSYIDLSAFLAGMEQSRRDDLEAEGEAAL